MTKHKDLFQVNILNTLVQLSGGNAACAAADPNAAGESVFLPAEQLSASGSASIIQMVCGGEKVPVIALSGTNPGQVVRGSFSGLPADCGGVRIEIAAVNPEDAGTGQEEVYRLRAAQPDNPADVSATTHWTPVRAAAGKAGECRFVELESYYPVNPGMKLEFQIERDLQDPASTYRGVSGIAGVRITPLKKLSAPQTVHDAPGYNSWPMIQAVGSKLICVYSRGTEHTIGEKSRGIYARTSSDGGKTWTPEVLVSNAPDVGEVNIGKGLDSTGAALFMVRCVGTPWRHELFRTADGISFERIAVLRPDPMPMQITDIFHVPGKGLMALWFAGEYTRDGKPHNSWGTLTSKDDGRTWTQLVMETGLTRGDWPTEPSAVYLGNGRILAIARSEALGNDTRRAQYQLESSDYGQTWRRFRTRICDVLESTPTLFYDPVTGLITNYYFHRIRGMLKRRTVSAERICGHPLDWPTCEVIASGSTHGCDAGNVNGTRIGNTHYLIYYSGDSRNTSIVMFQAQAPESGGE